MSNLLKTLPLTARQPPVVCTVTSAIDLSALADVMAQPCSPDILELRLDLLGELCEHAVSLTRKLAPAPPILLTARHRDEGGACNLSFTARETLLRRHITTASLIDIEIRSLETEGWDSLIKEVRSRPSPPVVIGSYHNFETTDTTDELHDVIDRGMQRGVDIVKIATRLNSGDDLARLEELLDCPPTLLAVMGMGGDLGKASRVRLAQLGSVLNYGFAAEESAPGQWQANDLVAQLRQQQQ